MEGLLSTWPTPSSYLGINKYIYIYLQHVFALALANLYFCQTSFAITFELILQFCICFRLWNSRDIYDKVYVLWKTVSSTVLTQSDKNLEGKTVLSTNYSFYSHPYSRTAPATQGLLSLSMQGSFYSTVFSSSDIDFLLTSILESFNIVSFSTCCGFFTCMGFLLDVSSFKPKTLYI